MLFLVFTLLFHHEGATVDHIAKTAFGFNSIYAQRNILDEKGLDNKTIFFSPFAEYSFVELGVISASVRLDIPVGFVERKLFFSDIAGSLKLTAKAGPILSLTPGVSVEFPTGGTLATSGHTGVLPFAAFELHLGPIAHLHGMIGAKFSLSDMEGHSDMHKVNYLWPHSEREIFSHIGAMFGILDIILIDVRPSLFLEDMKKLVFQPQAGLVLQIPAGIFDIKSHLYGFYALSGVRKGYGLGLIFYLMM